jgi:hypothetical protein
VLWMPETSFLRRHALFHDIVDSAGLPAYWQEHGIPDLCAAEPRVYGCKLRASRAASSGP